MRGEGALQWDVRARVVLCNGCVVVAPFKRLRVLLCYCCFKIRVIITKAVCKPVFLIISVNFFVVETEIIYLTKIRFPDLKHWANV